jgi:hypothetical protein
VAKPTAVGGTEPHDPAGPAVVEPDEAERLAEAIAALSPVPAATYAA